MGGTTIAFGAINQFWRQSYQLSKYLHTEENKCCYACGSTSNLERAHILAKVSGGSDYASNFHILCRLCHAESENLDGADYWIWFCLKSHFYQKGSLVPLEREIIQDENSEDEDSEGKEVYLPVEAELQTRIDENPLLFARLLLYKDNYITRYEDAWKKLEEEKSKFLEKEGKIPPFLPFPKTRLEFLKTFSMAMLGDLYEKYSEVINLGIAASEHAQYFLKGEL